MTEIIFKGHTCQHTRVRIITTHTHATVNMDDGAGLRMDERLFSTRAIETIRFLSAEDALAITEQVLVRLKTPGCKNVAVYGGNSHDDLTTQLLSDATKRLRIFLQKPAAIKFSYMRIPTKDSDQLVCEFVEIIQLVFKFALVSVYNTQNIWPVGDVEERRSHQTLCDIVHEMKRLFESNHYIFRVCGIDIMMARRDGLDW